MHDQGKKTVEDITKYYWKLGKNTLNDRDPDQHTVSKFATPLKQNVPLLNQKNYHFTYNI